MQAATASAVMTAAHAAARLADKLVAYRTRFTTALRAAWAATKQTVKNSMETPNKPSQVTRGTFTWHAPEVAQKLAAVEQEKFEARMIAEGLRGFGKSAYSPNSLGDYTTGLTVGDERYLLVRSAEKLYVDYLNYTGSYATIDAAYAYISAEAAEDNA